MGGERYRLPAMSLMTLAMYDSCRWTKEDMAKSKWTTAAMSNQMKLRNLPEFLHTRSKSVRDEYDRRKLLAIGGKLRVSASTTEELAKLLRQVLEAESTARAVDSARLQQQQQAEQDSSARSRRARRNRGSAASAIERKARAMSTDN